MNIVWLFPPSKYEGEIPLVSQNRWFKYLPFRTNFIYPVIAAQGITMMKEDGHDVKLLDCPTMELKWEDIESDIKRSNLIIMEARTAIMSTVWDAIARIKGISDANVALYGDHVMVRPFESLKNGADYIIMCGDYDHGARSLALTLESFDDAAQAIFKKDLLPTLDYIPFIDRELVPWKLYTETWRHKEAFGWIQSGRGCWAKCTFCSWAKTFYNHTIRTMSVKRVVDEIEYANKKYGIVEFLDDADTFIMKPWGLEFAGELINRDLDIFWNVQTRSELVANCTKEELDLMRESGLHVIKLGMDGTDDNSLVNIKKGNTLRDNEVAVKKIRDSNLESHINLVIGYPWQTKKEAYDGIKRLVKMKPNQAQFSLIQPFIGTEIYDQAIENNWFAIDPKDYDSWDMKRPILKGEMSSEEIAKFYRDSWAMFYFDGGYLAREILKSLRLAFEEKNLESFVHIWRGFKGVYYGHMKAMQ